MATQQSITSIWDYRPNEFKKYIGNLDDKTFTTVEDALSTFREVRSLPKGLKQTSIQQIISTQQIQRLFETLRSVMQPESKLKISTKEREEREAEIVENIADIYNIDIQKAVAKTITNQHRDKDDLRVFNYTLEVVIAPLNMEVSYAGKLIILGNINDSMGIDGGEKSFEGTYHWYDKYGEEQTSFGIKDILSKCGFVEGEYSRKKRHPCILYANLRCRCIDWLGAAGKTHINLEPFAEDIAETVSKLAHRVPSYKIEGTRKRLRYISERIGKDEIQIAKNYLLNFLKQRREDVEANPSLLIDDRITQSGVWYRIRPIMVQSGFRTESWGKTRRYLTSNINEFCTQLWAVENITREDLGIIAASKGVMLYDGEAYPLNIDSFKNLAKKGIVIIIIEKEGIADLLEPYAKKYKIALVHTQGRFTGAAKALIEAAKDANSIVSILVDYDAVGNDIVNSTPTPTPKIGIDKNIVYWLQKNGYPDLTIEDVQEAYTPSVYTDDEYLSYHRIELDSIQQKVGTGPIWDYIMYQLEKPEFSPNGFDIKRALNIREDIISENRELYPRPVKRLLGYLDDYNQRRLEVVRVRIETDELTGAKKLPEFENTKEDIEKKLGGIIAKDNSSSIQAITTALEDLMVSGKLSELEDLKPIEAEAEPNDTLHS